MVKLTNPEPRDNQGLEITDLPAGDCSKIGGHLALELQNGDYPIPLVIQFEHPPSPAEISFFKECGVVISESDSLTTTCPTGELQSRHRLDEIIALENLQYITSKLRPAPC